MSFVYFDKQRNRYVASFYIFDSGERKRRRKFFKEKAEAEACVKLNVRTQKLFGTITDFDLSHYQRLRSLEESIEDGSIEEAVNLWNSVTKLSAKTISTLWADFLEEKKRIGLGKDSLITLASNGKHILKGLGSVPLRGITRKRLIEFVASIPLTPTTRNGIVRNLNNFGKYLRAHDYANSEAFFDIPKEIVQPRRIKFITHTNTATFLKHLEETYPHLIPFNALRAFAGIRTGHLEKLSWDSLFPREKGIRMEADGKMLNDFIEGYPDNLWAWLARYSDQPLNGYNYGRLSGKILKNLKLDYPHNGFRHAFATYHVALQKDHAVTAFLLGHKGSSKVIHSNYKGRATERDAKSYFRILPRV